MGEILNSRARPARRAAPAVARALARAGVAGLAVLMAATALPALAAQHPGPPAASHARAAAAGGRTATGRINPGRRWVHLAAGDNHTCGIRSDGTLWCWGANAEGEVGIGSFYTTVFRPRQVTTPAARGWASVTTGRFQTCATRADGTLWCWGWNGYGQLGIGSHTDQGRPRQVTTPARGGWASISARGIHTCATRAGGTLWCWGDNASGELGTGNQTGQDRPRQVTTPARGGWASVTAGDSHTCAIRTGGTLWCWGDNSSGELGTGDTNGQVRPRQVTTPAPGGWARITAGMGYTCATRADATLWCWGNNDYGELGIGNSVGDVQFLPRQVTTPTPRGWVSVIAGGIHTCATRSGGTLWCWGNNDYGELGIGNLVSQDQPRQVSSPARGGWASLAANYIYTCAIRASGTLWCWGNNSYGQLGIGNPVVSQDRPRQVTSCMHARAKTARVRASPTRQPTGRHPGSLRPPV